MQEGPVHITLCGNTLAEYDHHAVVGPGVHERSRWAIKAFESGQDSHSYYITLITSREAEQVCLTLDTKHVEEKNVMVEPLGMQGPMMFQLWTFEDVDNRSGPITQARIQSVNMPWLSAAIGGDLNPPYHNVIGVSNQPNSKSQLWRLDYTPVNQ